jgi:hypothetical protein
MRGRSRPTCARHPPPARAIETTACACRTDDCGSGETVADDCATLASRRRATTLPGPVSHRQERVSFARRTGTEISNPVLSSGESANFRFLIISPVADASGGAREDHRQDAGGGDDLACACRASTHARAVFENCISDDACCFFALQQRSSSILGRCDRQNAARRAAQVDHRNQREHRKTQLEGIRVKERKRRGQRADPYRHESTRVTRSGHLI